MLFHISLITISCTHTPRCICTCMYISIQRSCTTHCIDKHYRRLVQQIKMACGILVINNHSWLQTHNYGSNGKRLYRAILQHWEWSDVPEEMDLALYSKSWHHNLGLKVLQPMAVPMYLHRIWRVHECVSSSNISCNTRWERLGAMAICRYAGSF